MLIEVHEVFEEKDVLEFLNGKVKSEKYEPRYKVCRLMIRLEDIRRVVEVHATGEDGAKCILIVEKPYTFYSNRPEFTTLRVLDSYDSISEFIMRCQK